MAMLAEPRQKRRYNLVPKGKPLFEDEDRFGTKMLEKMGWSKGKGLGKQEDGQQEFIRVRYKNDPDGLGYEERDDQWTQHEKHFNGLLESLNGGDHFIAPEECEKIDPKVGFGFQPNVSKQNLKDKFSGQSLEEKSKNSKARVHYKKFTKGKDMSQYSEKDLANIFGKKTTPGETNIYDQFQAFRTANDDEKSKENEEENGNVKNPFKLGTQIIHTGVSVSDYFKLKMAALKEKSGTLVNSDADKARTENDVEAETSSYTKETNKVQTEEDISQKKKKKKKKQIMEESEVEETISAESCEEDILQKKTKKKRSKEVESVMSCDLEITLKDTTTVEDAVDEAPQKKKKKNKRATEALEDKTSTTNEEHKPDNAIEERPCKKMTNKKSDTEKEGKHEETAPTELNENTAQHAVSSKKKKNKKVDLVFIESDDKKSNENFSNTIIDSLSLEKKKSKKNKENSTTSDHVTIPTETEIVEAPVSEKKKKKRTVAEMESTKRPYESESSTNDIPPKKKKKTQNLVVDLTDANSAEHNVEEEKEDTVSQAAESTKSEEKRSKKNKSTNDPTPLVEVSPPNDLNRLAGPCLLDTYKISTFCAEKFRNVELPRFYDSNISEINGYGLSENLQLNIITIKTDQERIMRLWNGTLNKYTHATPKRKIYNTYITKVKEARQNKSRIPSIKVKALKRQQVFQGL